MLIPQCCVLCLSRPPLKNWQHRFCDGKWHASFITHYSYHVPPNLECLLAIGTCFCAQNLSEKKMRQRFKTWAFDRVVCSVFRGLSHFRRRKVLHHAFVASAVVTPTVGHQPCKYTRRDICTYGTFKICFVALHVEVWRVYDCFPVLGTIYATCGILSLFTTVRWSAGDILTHLQQIFPLMFPYSVFWWD